MNETAKYLNYLAERGCDVKFYEDGALSIYDEEHSMDILCDQWKNCNTVTNVTFYGGISGETGKNIILLVSRMEELLKTLKGEEEG